MKKCIIEKSKKERSEKTLRYFSLEPKKIIIKTFSRQNPMTELCRTLFKYENKRNVG